MIGMSFADALFAFLLLWLIYLLVLWIRELNRVNRSAWSLSNGRLFHCDKCHHSFVLKKNENLTRCPRCNATCIAKRNRL